MTFAKLVLMNLARQRARTGLTVLGISIGIMTVVALGAIADGLKASASELLRSGDADFLVAQKGAADFTFSIVTEDDWQAIATRPGVARATGVLIHIVRVGSNPYFFALGIRPDQLAASPPPLLEGRLLSADAADEIVLGDRAATNLGAGVGDTVTIGERPMRVVGLFRSGQFWQDGGGYMALPTVQSMAGRQGVVTAVYVAVDPTVPPEMVASDIESTFPRLAAITSQAEFGEVDQGLQMIDAANLAISLLAVVIGAIGVMNTMVMSVFERTREIGIMRAVGWSGRRILQMIVGESLVVCGVAAIVGVLLGFAASRAVMMVSSIRGFLEPQIGVPVLVRALGVALVVAFVGAAYPAFRAIHLTPMEALRHE